MTQPTLETFLATNPNARHAFVSLARHPGNFGNRVYRAAFDYLKLPYTYTALTCSDLKRDIALIRRHGILGASITMPHKTAVLDLVDEVHPIADEISGANTVVNRDSKLVAFNTDYCGAEAALQFVVNSDHVAVLGKGAMARTFARALRGETEFIGRAELGNTNHKATVLINATPMGMPGINMPEDILDWFPNCDFYIECVVNETPTQKKAAARDISVFTGLEIAFQQAFAQFQLYTGMPAPEQVMREAIL